MQSFIARAEPVQDLRRGNPSAPTLRLFNLKKKKKKQAG